MSRVGAGTVSAAPAGAAPRDQRGAWGSIVAGCVAVVLYAAVVAAGWAVNGFSAPGLPRLSLGVPIIFAVAVAVRGVRELVSRLFRGPPQAPTRVLLDLAIVVSCLVVVALGAWLSDPGVFRLYGIWNLVLAAGFILPAAGSVSMLTELTMKFRAAARATVGAALAIGVCALATFGIDVVV